MATRYTVAFLGFSDFERSALASYFRLAGTRTPHYDQLQMLDDASFLVADADHPESVQLVRASERLDATVFIGARPPEDCMAWVSRPIDGLQVMRALDGLVAQAGRPMVTPMVMPMRGPALPTMQFDEPSPVTDGLGAFHASSPTDADNDDDAPATAPDIFVPDPSAILLEPAYAPYLPQVQRTVRRPRPPPGAVPPAVEAESLSASDEPPPPAPLPVPPALPMPPPPDQPRALLVDDSDIALRFLELRLQRWGLHADLASDSAQAQSLLALHSYDLVFLDVDLGAGSELGGLDLCQLIKQSPAAVQTAVVLVSAHHSELDRVRGTLAGCDAYLGKPLQDAELHRLLQRHGLKLSPTAA